MTRITIGAMSRTTLLSIIIGFTKLESALGQCFQDPDTNAEWAQIINNDTTSTEFSIEGSCCQETVCGLGCAEETPPPAKVRESGYFTSND